MATVECLVKDMLGTIIINSAVLSIIKTLTFVILNNVRVEVFISYIQCPCNMITEGPLSEIPRIINT